LGGLSAEELREQLDEIKRDSMLWRLQVDCLRYCRFVHLHHNAEDGDFFPELREANPAINSVIDRLQAEHRRVSDDLDAVEAAAGDPAGVLETARLADRLGYDLLAVQDHPYQRRHLDALALVGVILAHTERIRVFQDVGNLPLRPPAVFAKAAATLDLLSGG